LRAARSAPSGFTIRHLAIAHGDQLGPSGIVINTGPFEHIGFAFLQSKLPEHFFPRCNDRDAVALRNIAAFN
jgi:hypothetical protein